MELPTWEERCEELEEIKRANRQRIAALEAEVERLRQQRDQAEAQVEAQHAKGHQVRCSCLICARRRTYRGEE